MEVDKWKPVKGEGGKFDNKEIASWESWVNDQVQTRARNWMGEVWKWLTLAMGGVWTIDRYNHFMKITHKPVKTSDLAVIADHSIKAGEKRASHDIRHKFKIPLKEMTQLIPPKKTEKKEQNSFGGTGRPPGPPASGSVKTNAMWYARTAAASKMKEWADGMRDDVRWQVLQAIKEGVPPRALAMRLEKRWDDYGQRFGMIALTEINDAYNAGYLLAMPEHSYVTVPPINDDKVCRYCKKLLEGKIFEVLHHRPDHASRIINETCVWPGKSNVGQKSNNYIPCVPLHPNCRHKYVYYSGRPKKYDNKPNH